MDRPKPHPIVTDAPIEVLGLRDGSVRLVIPHQGKYLLLCFSPESAADIAVGIEVSLAFTVGQERYGELMLEAVAKSKANARTSRCPCPPCTAARILGDQEDKKECTN